MNFTFTPHTWCCTSPVHTAPISCLSSCRQLVNFYDWLPPSMWVMHISGWWLWPQIQTNPNEKYTKANVYDCLPPSMRVMHKSGAVAVLGHNFCQNHTKHRNDVGFSQSPHSIHKPTQNHQTGGMLDNIQHRTTLLKSYKIFLPSLCKLFYSICLAGVCNGGR